MKVSVVVPAYNEEMYLPSCLQSLAAQTYPCEIVVCDNNSTDRTGDIAARYASRVVREKRQGAMHATNAGLRAASGDLLAVTGADCSVPPDWIERFLPHFRDEGVIACYGPIDPLEGRHGLYFSAMNLAERVCIRLGLWFVIQGANFIVRKDIMEKAGYFDTKVELFEENGLFRKLKGMGMVKFVTSNPVKASSRRVDRFGKAFLIALGIRQMIKLTLSGKTDTSRFAPVRLNG
jgi:glycosyltransferase involved in cell wall biosynthesis